MDAHGTIQMESVQEIRVTAATEMRLVVIAKVDVVIATAILIIAQEHPMIHATGTHLVVMTKVDAIGNKLIT